MADVTLIVGDTIDKQTKVEPIRPNDSPIGSDLRSCAWAPIQCNRSSSSGVMRECMALKDWIAARG